MTASEGGQGRRLDEATVKEITGGDRVAARFLFQEFFEFTPTFKLILSTNHRPSVTGDDDGIWRRIRLVPFEQSFLGREDLTLADTLHAELPGILAWAVKGCSEWQRDGLGNATAVAQATQEYRDTEDVIGAFISECCRPGDGRVSVPELRQRYEQWCQNAGEEPVSAKQLTQALTRRHGITSARTKGARWYDGLTLAPPVRAADQPRRVPAG